MNVSSPAEGLNASLAAPVLKTGGLRSSRNKPSRLTEHIAYNSSNHNSSSSSGNQHFVSTEDLTTSGASKITAMSAPAAMISMDESLHLLEATRKVGTTVRKGGISHDSPTSPEEFQLSTSITNHSFNASLISHNEGFDESFANHHESLRGESSFQSLNNSDQNLVGHLQKQKQQPLSNDEQYQHSLSQLDDLASPPASPDDDNTRTAAAAKKDTDDDFEEEDEKKVEATAEAAHAQQQRLHASMSEISPVRQSKSVKLLGKIKKMGVLTMGSIKANHNHSASEALDAATAMDPSSADFSVPTTADEQTQPQPSSHHKFRLAAKARQSLIGSAMVLKNLTKKGPHKNMELLDDATTSTGIRSADSDKAGLRPPSGDEATSADDDDSDEVGTQPMIKAAQWDKEVAKEKRREKKLQRHEKLNMNISRNKNDAGTNNKPKPKQLDPEARARLKSYSQENAHRRRESARRRRQLAFDQTEQRDRTKSPARKSPPRRQVSDTSAGGVGTATTDTPDDADVLMTPSQHQQRKQKKVANEQVRQRVRNSLLQHQNSDGLIAVEDGAENTEVSASSQEENDAEQAARESIQLADLYRPQLDRLTKPTSSDEGIFDDHIVDDEHEMSMSELNKHKEPSALTDSTSTAPTEAGSSSFLQVSLRSVDHHDKCDDYVQLVIDDSPKKSAVAKKAPRPTKKSSSSIATKKTSNHSKLAKSSGPTPTEAKKRSSSKNKRPHRSHKKVEESRQRASDPVNQEHVLQALAEAEAENMNQSEPVFHYRHEPPPEGDETATDVGVRSDNKRSNKKPNAGTDKKSADAKISRVADPKRRRSSSLPPAAKKEGAPTRRQQSKVRGSAKAAESASVFRRQKGRGTEAAPETTVRRQHSKAQASGTGTSGNPTPAPTAARASVKPIDMETFHSSDSQLLGDSSKGLRSSARRPQPRRSIDDADAALSARKKKSSRGHRSSRGNRESEFSKDYVDGKTKTGRDSLEAAFQKRANKGYKTGPDAAEGVDDSTASASKAATIRW